MSSPAACQGAVPAGAPGTAGAGGSLPGAHTGGARLGRQLSVGLRPVVLLRHGGDNPEQKWILQMIQLLLQSVALNPQSLRCL